MPWRVKRLLILMACGFAVLGLSLAVLARHDSVDGDLLAIIGIVGGIAIIVTNLPENGDHGPP